jgi:hypothetical protein
MDIRDDKVIRNFKPTDFANMAKIQNDLITETMKNE